MTMTMNTIYTDLTTAAQSSGAQPEDIAIAERVISIGFACSLRAVDEAATQELNDCVARVYAMKKQIQEKMIIDPVERLALAKEILEVLGKVEKLLALRHAISEVSSYAAHRGSQGGDQDYMAAFERVSTAMAAKAKDEMIKNAANC